DLLALDDLTPPSAAVPVSRREVFVVPREIALRIPPVIERVLMDQNFYSGVGHWAAEVIIGLDVDFDSVAQTKSPLAAILFRRLNADLKLGQLVLFQPEERGPADMIPALRIPEIDPVFTQRHALGQFQRTPCAAECVQLRLALFDSGATRVVDVEF